jgi:hypothetical protein
MDQYVLIGVGVVVAAFVWFFIIRDTNEKTDVYVGKPKDPVKQQGGPGAPGRNTEVNTASKLPTAKTMESMTKAKLEDLGRELGVELDKRNTKAKMIAELKAGAK